MFQKIKQKTGARLDFSLLLLYHYIIVGVVRMSEYIEDLRKRIEAEASVFAKLNNFERMYISVLSSVWIKKNVETEEELLRAVKAMGEILTCPDYELAVELCRPAYKEKDKEKAEQAAAAVRRIKATETYAVNSKLCGYELLEKYENPETFLTDAFSVHANMILDMYKYVKKFIEE